MSNRLDKIRIFIVDDHPLFRQGLRQAVAEDARFELVGEAADGRTAVNSIRTLSPDLAVLDINLPDITGLEVAALLRAENARTKLVFLTMLKDQSAFNHAMNVGAQGFLLKDSAVMEITNCLVSVAADIPYVSPVLSGFLLNRRQKTLELAARTPALDDLTTAERRVLKRIADKSTKEIAAEFNVSPRTIETHRANIGAKLEFRGNNSLLQFAIENRDALKEV